MKYDLVVIGGGPAGYVGAIRAAQLGKKVACVEADRAGGTCLNWGCIPTKSLLRNAELYHLLKHRSKEFGITFDNLAFDWSAVIGRSRKVSDRLAAGIEFLFKKNKIDYLRGHGGLVDTGVVRIANDAGETTDIQSAKILLATGCRSRSLPDLPFNGKTVISSREAMTLEKQPASMAIVGAGAIGVEFAYFYNAFGTKVTLIEMLPRLLPQEDHEVSGVLDKAFRKQGIKIRTETKVAEAENRGSHVVLNLKGKKTETIDAEVCLVAVGVTPVLPPGTEEVGLTDRGYIATNERYATNLAGVYAAGDLTGPPWLAHTASYEAIQCVEGLFKDGHNPKKVGLFPGGVYCHPQVASIGLTEQAAKDQGIAHRIGRFPFRASGKAQAVGETDGFVKILFGEPRGEILGAHLIGDNATELIAELGLAMGLKATWTDIEGAIHAHPTLSEAVHEAAGNALGHAIHV